MKRRDFIRLSLSAAPLIPFLGCTEISKKEVEKQADLLKLDPNLKYDIEVQSDMSVGHLAFESFSYPKSETLQSEYVVVGGGIAGLSAAYTLKNEDFLLFELSDNIGGNSGSHAYENLKLCQGAHYDLAYPDYYGKEVLDMLKELDIIYFDERYRYWNFKDEEHIIDQSRHSRTFFDGKFRDEVLPSGELKDRFLDIIMPYEGKMPCPTRLIDAETQKLNAVSFTDFLKEKGLSITPDFLRGMDYQMLDDYGAGAADVSALAGIHYYQCRPYFTQHVELFSPPEGNFYFAEKIAGKLPEEKIKLRHLVRRIHKTNKGFKLEVVDAQKKEVKEVLCSKIVYAGHKHALKHIYPKDYPLFEKNDYAPWMVMNIILKNTDLKEAYWQNEIIDTDRSFLGFVDSDAQTHKRLDSKYKGRRLLTVYFCFPPTYRKELASLNNSNSQMLVNESIAMINKYYNYNIQPCIEKIFIKAIGHAMAIPSPGFLFDDKNAYRSEPGLVYAGVDNSRLPIFFEASDSGLKAAEMLKNLT